jgi:hypothetical protein
MSKYRVIKAVNGYGGTIYVPQYRRFLIWRDMDQSRRYHDILSAIRYVRTNGICKKEEVLFEI